jgi:FkbM family methyltransferase
MRKFIRNILNRFGYEIIKTGIPYIPKSTKPGFAAVGKYQILMPGNNVQLINYKLYPDLNGQLGRLASCIFKKYPGMTVIDVGANVGDTIAVLKSAVDVPVIGIEGDEVSFEYLQKNCQQFKNVSVIKTFLGEKSQQVNVSFENSGWNTTVIPDAKSTEQVSFKTLDEVISDAKFNTAQIKLLKVDVEGFDTIVLRGAYKIIEKNKPVLFFEYNRQNMIAINEEGLSTVLSFGAYGYNRIVFFDHKGALVLATNMRNKEEITYLHNYISSKKTLLGYYDICIFHADDDAIASDFMLKEEQYL